MKNFLVWVAILGAIYAFRSMSMADRDENGTIISGGDIDAFSIKVGDCFNDSNSILSAFGDDEVSSVAGVPCSEPHDNEVYSVFDVNMSSYPGEESMGKTAFDSCVRRFESFVGKDYEASSLDVMPMYPSAESWRLQNDREVVCAVYDMNLAKLEGSMRGSRL